MSGRDPEDGAERPPEPESQRPQSTSGIRCIEPQRSCNTEARPGGTMLFFIALIACGQPCTREAILDVDQRKSCAAIWKSHARQESNPFTVREALHNQQFVSGCVRGAYDPHPALVEGSAWLELIPYSTKVGGVQEWTVPNVAPGEQLTLCGRMISMAESPPRQWSLGSQRVIAANPPNAFAGLATLTLDDDDAPMAERAFGQRTLGLSDVPDLPVSAVKRVEMRPDLFEAAPSWMWVWPSEPIGRAGPGVPALLLRAEPDELQVMSLLGEFAALPVGSVSTTPPTTDAIWPAFEPVDPTKVHPNQARRLNRRSDPVHHLRYLDVFAQVAGCLEGKTGPSNSLSPYMGRGWRGDPTEAELARCGIEELDAAETAFVTYATSEHNARMKAALEALRARLALAR